METQKMVISLLVGLVLIFTSAFVPGCNGNGGMDGWDDAEFETETNGELQEGMEETGEDLEQAGERTGEELEEAGEEIDRELDELDGQTEFDRTREYNGGPHDYLERDTGRSEFPKDYSY